jgi:hypothetical protein
LERIPPAVTGFHDLTSARITGASLRSVLQTKNSCSHR